MFHLTIARAIVSFVLTAFFLASTGCATILGGGSNKTMTVSSVPSGQTVEVHNKSGAIIDTRTTPFTITVPRGRGWFDSERYTFSVKPAGYEQVVKAELNAWYFGNLLFGGIIGLVIVDPLTGGMWDFPSQLELKKSAMSK